MQKNVRENETPTVGLEPTITKLRALRSADWARRALQNIEQSEARQPAWEQLRPTFSFKRADAGHG